eukprot:gene15881-17871_t
MEGTTLKALLATNGIRSSVSDDLSEIGITKVGQLGRKWRRESSDLEFLFRLRSINKANMTKFLDSAAELYEKMIRAPKGDEATSSNQTTPRSDKKNPPRTTTPSIPKKALQVTNANSSDRNSSHPVKTLTTRARPQPPHTPPSTPSHLTTKDQGFAYPILNGRALPPTPPYPRIDTPQKPIVVELNDKRTNPNHNLSFSSTPSTYSFKEETAFSSSKLKRVESAHAVQYDANLHHISSPHLHTPGINREGISTRHGGVIGERRDFSLEEKSNRETNSSRLMIPNKLIDGEPPQTNKVFLRKTPLPVSGSEVDRRGEANKGSIYHDLDDLRKKITQESQKRWIEERIVKEAKQHEEQERLARETKEREEQERRARETKEREEQERRARETKEREEQERRARETKEREEQERRARETKEREEQERRARETKEREEQERRARETKEREEQERRARETKEREEQERRARETKEREEQERRARETKEREEQERRARETKEREEQERRARETKEREEQERRARETKEREEQERRARETKEREEQERRARETKEREEQERRARETKEREEQERRARETKEREEQERRARETKEREEQERRARETKEREEQERRARETKEREEQERRARETKEREEQERRARETKEREEQERRARETKEREEQERRARETKEREEQEKRVRETKEREEQKRLREVERREEQERLAREGEKRDEPETHNLSYSVDPIQRAPKLRVPPPPSLNDSTPSTISLSPVPPPPSLFTVAQDEISDLESPLSPLTIILKVYQQSPDAILKCEKMGLMTLNDLIQAKESMLQSLMKELKAIPRKKFEAFINAAREGGISEKVEKAFSNTTIPISSTVTVMQYQVPRIGPVITSIISHSNEFASSEAALSKKDECKCFEGEHGETIIIAVEEALKKEALILEFERENQIIEDISNLIVNETKYFTKAALEVMTQSKVNHQERAKRLKRLIQKAGGKTPLRGGGSSFSPATVTSDRYGFTRNRPGKIINFHSEVITYSMRSNSHNHFDKSKGYLKPSKHSSRDSSGMSSSETDKMDNKPQLSTEEKRLQEKQRIDELELKKTVDT